MAFYHEDYNNEREIDDILNCGLNNIYTYCNRSNNNHTTIQTPRGRSNDIETITQIENQIDTLHHKVNGFEKKLCASPYHCKTNTNTLNKITKKKFNNIINKNKEKDDLLLKTRSILRSKSKGNVFDSSISPTGIKHVKNNQSKNMIILQEETNQLWKEKYEKLDMKYKRISNQLRNEKKSNNDLDNQIKCRQRKKDEIAQLAFSQDKLTKANKKLLTQYHHSENTRKYQSELIIRLQEDLYQLRFEFQNKSPIEISK